jgi:hypothetical protein
LDEATLIKSFDEALAAILLIKGEGEGTQGSPDQPPPNSATFAHYYVFKEIYTQKTLVQDAAGNWSFTGAAIPFPTSFDFQQSTIVPSPSLAFNQALSKLLIGLQTCWTTNAPPSTSDMGRLQTAGITLIKQGTRVLVGSAGLKLWGAHAATREKWSALGQKRRLGNRLAITGLP